MRESSSNLFYTKRMKRNRGGEQKVMKKSLSLLLSIAMAFSIFASVAMGAEAKLTVEAKYQALVEAGIFTGSGDDQAAELDREMRRSEFAAVLVRAFELSEDTAASNVYVDLDGAGWAAGYIGAVTKAGLMNGMTADEFGPSLNVTMEQLATVLVRAFDLQQSTSGVTGTVSDWARGYVGAALQAGLISAKADYSADALRADLVESAYVVLEIVESIKTPEVSYAVSSAKEITVTFNKPVDADKVTFDVRFGLVKSNISEVKWSDDKKVATLSFGSNLQPGDYAITVTGAAATELKGNVKVELEKVGTIEILSDVAPVVRDGGYAITGAKVYYKVYNQYGQDVTKTASVQWYSSINGPESAQKPGVLEIAIPSNNYFYQVGSEFTLSGNVSGSLVNVNKTLKLGEESRVTTIETDGLFSLNEEPLNVLSDYTGYYVLLNLKDQYGNPVEDLSMLNDTEKTQVIVMSSRPDLVPVHHEKMFVSNQGPDENQIAFRLPGFEEDSQIRKDNSGTAVLTFSPRFGGESATVSIDVKKAAVVSNIQLIAPDKTVSVGETHEIKFTATDEDGKEITDFSILNDQYYGVDLMPPAEWVNKDGKGKGVIEFTAPNHTGPVTMYAFVRSTGKQAVLTIHVMEKKYPTAVDSIPSLGAFLVDVEGSIAGEKVVVLDQYSNVMTTNAAFFEDYALKVVPTGATVTGLTYDSGKTYYITGPKETIKFTKGTQGNIGLSISVVEKVGAGFRDIEVNNRNYTTGSTKDFSVRYVNWNSIVSFDIADIAKLYSNFDVASKYSVNSPTVDVHGKLSNGTKVNIGDNYVLSTETTGIKIDDTGKKVLADGTEARYIDSNETKGLVRAVIIKENSPSISKEVTISRATPVVSKVVLEKELKDGEIALSELSKALNVGLLKGLKATDQYGIEQAQFKKDASVIVSEVSKGSTIKNAERYTGLDTIIGADNAKVGDQFTVTIISGGTVNKVTLTVVADPAK